jgi:hypothetical protein
LDSVTLNNAWLVMAADVGMSWMQFKQFLQLHQERFTRMRKRLVSTQNSDSLPAKEEQPPSASKRMRLPLEVVDSSVECIRQVQSQIE